MLDQHHPGRRAGSGAGQLVLLLLRHANRTSVALAPVDVNEHWGIVHASRPRTGRIGNLRINLGAPGDRRDDRGGLWLAIPRPYDRQPYWFPKALDPGEIIQVRGGTAYRRHSDLVALHGTSIPWVLASGVSGQLTVSVDVSRMPAESRYAVRLHFAEFENLSPGQRIFDVKVAGQKVLEAFDIAAAAGGPRTAVVQECVVQATGRLTIELVPNKGDPILSGIEILPREPAAETASTGDQHD